MKCQIKYGLYFEISRILQFINYDFLTYFTQLKLQSRTAVLITSITLGRGKETRHASATVRVGIGLLKRRIDNNRCE